MAEGVRSLPSPIKLDDFDIGVTLGTGSFGRVRFVTHKVIRPACLLQIIIDSLAHKYFPPGSLLLASQATGSFWAIKMLKKAEVIRLQQV
jgi:hypothetical protein